jgi:hypothetical protein
MRIPAFWRTALLVVGIGFVAALAWDAARPPPAEAGEKGPTYLVNRELLHLSSPWLDLNPSALATMDEIAEEVSASELSRAR